MSAPAAPDAPEQSADINDDEHDPEFVEEGSELAEAEPSTPSLFNTLRCVPLAFAVFLTCHSCSNAFISCLHSIQSTAESSSRPITGHLHVDDGDFPYCCILHFALVCAAALFARRQSTSDLFRNHRRHCDQNRLHRLRVLCVG
jgi:hypothetical protein